MIGIKREGKSNIQAKEGKRTTGSITKFKSWTNRKSSRFSNLIANQRKTSTWVLIQFLNKKEKEEEGALICLPVTMYRVKMRKKEDLGPFGKWSKTSKTRKWRKMCLFVCLFVILNGFQSGDLNLILIFVFFSLNCSTISVENCSNTTSSLKEREWKKKKTFRLGLT